MGFIITIIYVLFIFLSPAELFPTLAPYRIQVWLAVLATLATLTTVVLHGYPTRAPQNFLLFGFFLFVMFSWLTKGWMGGVLMAFNYFGPIILVYFLVAANLISPWRIQSAVFLIIGVAVYYSIRGIMAYHYDVGWQRFLFQTLDQEGSVVGLARVRGVGPFEDPNDLGQLLATALALLGFFWKKNSFWRGPFVILPLAGLLLYACYLTRSRGTIVGLTVLFMFWMAQKGRTVLGVLVGAGSFAIMRAAGFSGGRSMSVQAGSDRYITWGEGLQMFKNNPLFGVGLNGFLEQSELTAHNSYVLCLAEQGFLGYFLWLGALVVTFIGTKRFLAEAGERPEAQQYASWIRTTRLALITWMTTSFFLSRTYSITLYLLLGIIVAILRLGWQQIPDQAAPELSPKRFRFLQWAPLTVGAELASIVLVYAMIRVGGLLGI